MATACSTSCPRFLGRGGGPRGLPFGAPVVWGSIGVWLLLQGQVGAGIGLLLWGALVINWIDNLVRPLVISGVAKIPFLLVLFGVMGGLAAFGLIGLFVNVTPSNRSMAHALENCQREAAPAPSS